MFARKKLGGMKIILELTVYVAIAAVMSALAAAYLENVLHVFYY